MAAGDGLTVSQREEIARAVGNADRLGGLDFSVYVGPAESDARAHALRLHASLEDPERSVIVLCDPAAHRLEVVTGRVARRQLDDTSVALAVVSMQTFFRGGDLVGGLAWGVQQLGEAARQPKTLHQSTA